MILWAWSLQNEWSLFESIHGKEIKQLSNEQIMLIHAHPKYAQSFGEAVDLVARERRYLASTTGFPLASTLEFIGFVIENNLAQYFAVQGEKVIGWCDIMPKGFEGLNHVGVLGMGLLPEFRGLGLGRKLMDITLAHARDVNGLEKVELEVFATNTAGIRLYERTGFQLEGRRVRARKIDGNYDDLILMGLFL
ncbi:MAG: GNAT family N-acetyltransferase [Candidatus Wallbacteria bacterium HGW-Wallbacteria-1]|jgi:RimJ/RimL family protein N-acetyltransferase|uniref:GNAT family N-acetyltransferase n=1 Tax=Candidatus Wallbacteria bacterium HGW-Wallbacteria-1 TaxID=2013854 RepID=A0A2N1PKX3_9BACT|nr:MAG: GNAT family N-acetyltransferase [Candidatus Wallbacteria bacterium HGW-Wallbacteria-1]